jgi:uncharacterized protein with PIN domain
MDARFIADRNLGKLAKWLRILGYDTLYERENADRAFFRKAREAGRIVLTRRREVASRMEPQPIFAVKADRVEAQIREVLEGLGLNPDPARRMSRCLICNALLEAVPKEAVESLVPAYVWRTSERFFRCLACGRIYWPGTHPRHIEAYLRTRIPAHPP